MGSIAPPTTVRLPWGGAENIYRRVSLAFKHVDREHWRIHCVCAVSFHGLTPDEQTTCLRNAWKVLVTEHPRLAVEPDGTTSKTYEVLDNESIEAWAQDTFFVEDTRTPDEVIRTTEPRDLPSLHFHRTTSELVLLSSHWRMDAVGCMMLLNQLLALTASTPKTTPESPETQISRISAPLEDAANCPPLDASSASKSYAETWIENMHRNAIHAGGLPYNGETTTPPSETTHHDITLTRASTAALLAACKAKQISVSAAIHAALAHTVFSFSEDQEFTTVMAVNLRPYLPPPYNGPKHAVQTYVASIIPTVSRDAPFTDSARALSKSYKTWYSEEFIHALRWIYTLHAEKLFRPPPPSPPSPEAVTPKPPSAVTLSSIGVVESHIQREYIRKEKGVSVTGFRFGVTMMTRQMLLYPWTFRDRLTLSLCYNEAYYDLEMAGSVLERLRRVLEGELGVELV
ncbi:hypothetical protein BDV25DRAFT_169805 [Aspergillus avenaceus]|uniref:Phthiocerol/phthiodiolone dimycocerosyl transferase C-terminal domain-containing protein n=1 Tax=Aspergillus avenaceus TaxID=36643 RepID=A0A5N6TJP6_ASPAV|nr:hypothetical protein BDV25DRAFT_169805 [Aspergillus avenaceus]